MMNRKGRWSAREEIRRINQISKINQKSNISQINQISNISQIGTISRINKIRLVKWKWRARRQKLRWFSSALKRKAAREPRRWKQTMRSVCSFCLWMGLGVFMLVVSWELFWRMGEASVSGALLSKGETANEKIADRMERVEGLERKEAGEKKAVKQKTWIRQGSETGDGERFGIELRIQDGKIVFFREKEENLSGMYKIKLK